MTFMDTEDGAWGSYNPTVEAARREAFDLRCEVRQLKKELNLAKDFLRSVVAFSGPTASEIEQARKYLGW